MNSSSSACIGASAGGSLTELIAKGAGDAYLTFDPTITWWRQRYNRYTNFAMEPIEQTFNSQVAYGAEVQITINRNADLIHWMYLIIDLPGLACCQMEQQQQAFCGGFGSGMGGVNFPCCNPCAPCPNDPPPPNANCPRPAGSAANGCAPTPAPVPEPTPGPCIPGPWCTYVNAIGQFLPRRACLIIGGSLIVTLYNHFLFMWEELSGAPGKRLMEMIGKYKDFEQMIEASKYNRRLYVPLPFWFTLSAGNSLACVSLQFHSIQLTICFEELRNCIQRSGPDVIVQNVNSCMPLTPNDINARLDCTFVFLDVMERDRFAVGCFESMIYQCQLFYNSVTAATVRCQLNFNHMIVELIWALQRKCQADCNNHFNYSGAWNRDPIDFVNLRLNNLQKFTARNASYFRLVQPYQHHRSIPRAFVYCYSFALHPEETCQPSGSANFSRIDSVELIFDIQEPLQKENLNIYVYGINWQVFRYRDGLGGTAFAA